MQRPDEKKRRQILDAATKLFSTRPFHEVKLDEVAAAAGVGKGTLYVYFESKESLFLSIIHGGFDRTVEAIEARLADPLAASDPREAMRAIVAEFVRYATRDRHLFEAMRSAAVPRITPQHQAKRRELSRLIAQTIRRGIDAGLFDDPHPEITAHMIPGMVRSIVVFGPKRADPDVITRQVTRVLESGLLKKGKGR